MKDRIYRKKMNTMITGGRGIILLGLWTAVRFVLSMFMDNKRQMELISEEFDVEEPFRGIITAITIFFIVQAVLAEVGVRFIIGVNAISEGRGRKKKGFYLFMLVLLIIFNAGLIIIEVIGISMDGFSDVFTLIASLILDITSLIISIDVFSAARYVRKIRKNRKE